MIRKCLKCEVRVFLAPITSFNRVNRFQVQAWYARETIDCNDLSCSKDGIVCLFGFLDLSSLDVDGRAGSCMFACMNMDFAHRRLVSCKHGSGMTGRSFRTYLGDADHRAGQIP